MGLAEILANQQSDDWARHQQYGVPNSCTGTSGYGYSPQPTYDLHTQQLIAQAQLTAALQKQPAQQPAKPTIKPEGSLFTEIATDVKSFILQHRATLYFIALALIIDHLLFKDAFRHRLQGMCDKIITKVEEKIGT